MCCIDGQENKYPGGRNVDWGIEVEEDQQGERKIN
jgi:hypothetical protein